MKSIMLSICLFLIMTLTTYAQSPVMINSWVPVLVNNTQYVQTVVPVTTYQIVNVPVAVPTIQYYQVPLVYYGPNYQPVVQLVKPCYFCPGKYYYVRY